MPANDPRSVLVTGGAGYIGSHVTRRLSEAGYRPVVIDDLSTGSASALIHGEPLVVGDVGDAALVERVLLQYRCSTVLHFAASIVAPESVSDPLKYYSNNTASIIGLLRACVRTGVQRFVFSSTAAVYGIPESGIAAEDSATSPINPYGASKLMCERMLQDASAAHGFRFAVLRYFNVAGADPRGRMGQRTPNATHLIKVCCLAALHRRPDVSVYGTDYATPDGTGVRDYIHVEDLAEAHLAALTYLEDGGASVTLNVGYGTGRSVNEVIASAKRVSRVDFPVVIASRRPGDPPILVADASRVRQILSWVPRYADLDTIVSHAFAWERQLGA